MWQWRKQKPSLSSKFMFEEGTLYQTTFCWLPDSVKVTVTERKVAYSWVSVQRQIISEFYSKQNYRPSSWSFPLQLTLNSNFVTWADETSSRSLVLKTMNCCYSDQLRFACVSCDLWYYNLLQTTQLRLITYHETALENVHFFPENKEVMLQIIATWLLAICKARTAVSWSARKDYWLWRQSELFTFCT